MITIVLVIVGVLFGLVVVMALIGLTLRADHLAARSAVLPRSAEEVYALIRRVEDHPTWRTDLKRVELLPAAGGKPSFREHGKQGAITYVVDEDSPPAAGAPGRLVTRIADDKLPFGGRWILTVAPAGAGARLTITEDGFVKNPVFRFLSRTVFSLTATMEHYLRALGKHIGAEVTPEPAEPVTGPAPARRR